MEKLNLCDAKPTHLRILDPVTHVELMKEFGIIVEDELLVYAEQSYSVDEPEIALYVKVSLPSELYFDITWREDQGVRLCVMKKEPSDPNLTHLYYCSWVTTTIFNEKPVYERHGGGVFSPVSLSKFTNSFAPKGPGKEAEKRMIL